MTSEKPIAQSCAFSSSARNVVNHGSPASADRCAAITRASASTFGNISNGRMKLKTISLDLGSDSTNSRVARIASAVRYCVTPSQEQNVLVSNQNRRPAERQLKKFARSRSKQIEDSKESGCGQLPGGRISNAGLPDGRFHRCKRTSPTEADEMQTYQIPLQR